jgi:hypothetical protein
MSSGESSPAGSRVVNAAKRETIRAGARTGHQINKLRWPEQVYGPRNIHQAQAPATLLDPPERQGRIKPVPWQQKPNLFGLSLWLACRVQILSVRRIMHYRIGAMMTSGFQLVIGVRSDQTMQRVFVTTPNRDEAQEPSPFESITIKYGFPQGSNRFRSPLLERGRIIRGVPFVNRLTNCGSAPMNWISLSVLTGQSLFFTI